MTTAHPDASPEAFGTPAEPGNAVEDFAKYLDEASTDDPEEEEELDESEAEEGDEPDDAEETDEQDEPETAIDAPISFNKEQKAAFAQLPADLQQTIADTEAQRNREVQLRTTEAAEAKRTAQAEAQSQLAATQKQYADELAEYAKAFEPQEPDYSLIATDPQAFAEQMAFYKQMTAQRDYLTQQSATARQQAEAAELQSRQQAMQAQHQKLISVIPEWADPEARAKLVSGIEAVGRELGYTDEVMRQADASDVLALKKASDWKAKAEKYDALQSRKMEAVRNAKTKPKVMKPNGSETRAEQGPRRTEAAWQRAKQTRNADDFADYLTKAGIL